MNLMQLLKFQELRFVRAIIVNMEKVMILIIAAVMPANLYGPGDNYHSENSHVIPALIRKIS